MKVSIISDTLPAVELIFIFILSAMPAALFVSVYLWGLIFPNLPLRLLPVLNCSTVLAASLLVQFIGTLGDLRGHIDRFLGHGVKNAPFDHRDLHGVVHAEARDHGINKYRERLPPRQWHESRETHERQDGARERIRREG